MYTSGEDPEDESEHKEFKRVYQQTSAFIVLGSVEILHSFDVSLFN